MAILLDLFWHFVDYFHSWRGTVALAVAALLVLYKVRAARKQSRSSADDLLPISVRQYDCGGRSYLDEREDDARDSVLDSDEETTEAPRVKALFVYPLKSCKGIEVPVARVTRTGFRYDRLFSLAERRAESDVSKPESQWRFITQREYPKLALIDAELWLPNDSRKLVNEEPKQDRVDPVRDVRANGGFLLVRFPSQDTTVDLRLPLSPTPERAMAKGYQQTKLTVWLDNPQAIDMTSEISPKDLEKLRSFLGVKTSLALFRTDESNLRTITRSLPKDRPEEHFEVGFADAFPVHLINVASVRELHKRMQDQYVAASIAHHSSTTSLDVRRFRANIIVSGASAYSEDCWKRLTMGTSLDGTQQPATYHAACRTARCPLANVDQDTGIMARHEPLRTLRRTRAVDEGAKPHAVLGLSMIPRCRLGKISVGDRIEVLQTGEHFYEKMFK